MMETLKNTREKLLTPAALTALRVSTGIVMIVHGWMKATDYSGWVSNVGSMGMPLPEVMAPLAIAGELGGGVGLLLGLLTPLAALGVLSTMAFAIGFVHLGNGLLAKNGGFEYPLTIAMVSLFFVARGAGPISLDRLIFGATEDGDEEAPSTAPQSRIEAHA